jgi:hypothetical protein
MDKKLKMAKLTLYVMHHKHHETTFRRINREKQWEI